MHCYLHQLQGLFGVKQNILDLLHTAPPARFVWCQQNILDLVCTATAAWVVYPVYMNAAVNVGSPD